MKKVIFISIILTLFLSNSASAQHFEANWESLKQYECPDWFRDAKLGIFLHWGPTSVPATGGWYGRDMYIQGDPAYESHLKKYGHPSVFGYKDIIPLWKAENFDADKLVKIFKKAGARYIVPVAVHHDNFDLWDSKYQSWNSVNMGPHKDIVGMWRKAALDNGLIFGVSTHMDRTPSWFNTSRGSDTSGPYKGISYDGADKRYSELYGPENTEGMHWAYLPKHASQEWKETWYRRTKDLITKYNPDLLYFDGGIPYVELGLKLVSEFYNHNMEVNNGHLEAVLNLKITKVSGAYQEGMCVQDLERSKLEGIKAEPWQTDNSIGDWFYKNNDHYESPNTIIDLLVDIVSKNGNLLLNIPLRADGTLDSEETSFLDEMGKWFTVNGEAIHGTRPWIVYGEGPTIVKQEYTEKIKESFTSQDIRFTTKGETLYAIALDWPEDGTLKINSLGKNKDAKAIKTVQLLGHKGNLHFTRDNERLIVTLPKTKPCNYAYSLKIN
jgi:alpha-L-fucosidase